MRGGRDACLDRPVSHPQKGTIRAAAEARRFFRGAGILAARVSDRE